MDEIDPPSPPVEETSENMWRSLTAEQLNRILGDEEGQSLSQGAVCVSSSDMGCIPVPAIGCGYHDGPFRGSVVSVDASSLDGSASVAMSTQHRIDGQHNVDVSSVMLPHHRNCEVHGTVALKSVEHRTVEEQIAINVLVSSSFSC